MGCRTVARAQNLNVFFENRGDRGLEGTGDSARTGARAVELRLFPERAALPSSFDSSSRDIWKERTASSRNPVIAVEVFGRKAGYDPKLDAIVRTEAVRLRARLEKYYQAEGSQRSVNHRPAERGLRPVLRERATVAEERAVPAVPQKTYAPAGARRRQSWRIAAVVVVFVSLIALGITWSLAQADYFWRNPLAGARTERLTDFPGDEVDAAISPDGKFMAFLSDRAGPFDVWLNQVGTDEFVNVTKGKITMRRPR